MIHFSYVANLTVWSFCAGLAKRWLITRNLNRDLFWFFHQTKYLTTVNFVKTHQGLCWTSSLIWRIFWFLLLTSSLYELSWKVSFNASVTFSSFLWQINWFIIDSIQRLIPDIVLDDIQQPNSFPALIFLSKVFWNGEDNMLLSINVIGAGIDFYSCK